MSAVDLLIVGSGPIGASIARFVSELRPRTHILMVESGPALTQPPGAHITSRPQHEHEAILAGAQGPARGVVRDNAVPAAIAEDPPGMFRHFAPTSAFPGAAGACCVGGMGVLWGALTPRPTGSERIPFIEESDWNDALMRAESILGVSQALAGGALGGAIRKEVGARLDGVVLPLPEIHVTPSAVHIAPAGNPVITGPADILAPVRHDLSIAGGSFSIRAATLCRSVLARSGRAAAVELQDRASGAIETVSARIVVIAADTFRTPQLLWASGIRHCAVGRYLSDHLMAKATIDLDRDIVEECRREGGPLGRSVTSVSFAEGSHPFHGTILQGLVNLVPGSWVRIAEGGAVPETMTSMTWLSRTTPQQSNRVTFDDAEKDWTAMPKMAVEFELTASDKAERERAIELVRIVGKGLGDFLPGREPTTLAPGRSYHFTGTVRMGASDDGASVCDRYGRVWGLENLFVAGNGLIPTATTVNPTLTSVALAAMGSGEIVRSLG